MKLVDNTIKEIRKLCELHHVKSMYLFGSQVSNPDQSSNDLDLLVEFSDSLELLDYADNYFSLLEKLESLTSEKVDLVSATSLKNSILIESINQSKKLIYESEDSKVLT
ncbi:MAG: nucleotidyltransferase domain-containing protein [Cyclobacteriaceae bacterium]